MNRVFFIAVIFTSSFLLPFSVTCIFVSRGKMDVEAWSDCQWFWEGLVMFGIILLNLFHWVFWVFFFNKIFPAAKMSFRNADIPEAAFLFLFSGLVWFWCFLFVWLVFVEFLLSCLFVCWFGWGFFAVAKIELIFFQDYFICFWSLIDEKIFFDGCIYCAYN